MSKEASFPDFVSLDEAPERYEQERKEREHLLSHVREARAKLVEATKSIHQARDTWLDSKDERDYEAMKQLEMKCLAVKEEFLKTLYAYASWTSTELVQPGAYNVKAVYEKKWTGKIATYELELNAPYKEELQKFEERLIERIAFIGMHNLGMNFDVAHIGEAEFVFSRKGEEESLDRTIRFFAANGSLLHYSSGMRSAI